MSSFFADIFKNNALNNGLLPVQVSDAFLSKLFADIEAFNPKITVDLEDQVLRYAAPNEIKAHFDISAYKKHCLLNGQTDFDFLVSQQRQVEQFEMNRTHAM